MSPIDVTLEQALELLAQPKAARRGFGAKREPLKVFDESPVTKQKIELLEGRYGLYLTDGETNASLPKGAVADELTQEQALELLAARAAMGPSKKKKAKRSSAASTKSKRAKKSATGSAEGGANGKSPTKKKSPAKRKTAAKKS